MKEIEKLAQKYVESFGEVLPGYKYGYKDFKEFISKYYYDFVFITLDNKIPKNPPVAGGACGFTIDKTNNKIDLITVADLTLLEKKDSEIEDIYNKITELKENNNNLNWLKSKYNLNSSKLLNLKRIIAKTTFKKENIIEQINDLINNIS